MTTQERVRPGRIGEIWVAGESVARGYWNRPDLSDAAFGARIAASTGQEPFLRTGDLGFLDGGKLFVTGRLKDMIIVRGRNIYAQDVERTVERVLRLSRANSVAAFALDGDATEGVGGTVGLDDHVVQQIRRVREAGDAGPIDSVERVLSAAREALVEEFEAPVRALALVRPGSFPLTTSGKVRRVTCKAMLESRADDIIYLSLEAYSAPPAEEERPTGTTSASSPDPQRSRERADAIIAWFRAYADRRINSRLADERRLIPPHVVLDFGNCGLMGLQVPPELGGQGLCVSDLMRVAQQLAAVDLSLALLVGIHNGLGIRPIMNFGRPSIRDTLLPELATGRRLAAFALTETTAGANPNAIRARAVQVPGGWRVTAEKQWVGLGSWAGCITVFANAEDADGAPLGMVALAVPDDASGLSHGPEALTTGARGIVQTAADFDDVFVPDSNALGSPGEGMRVAQDAMMFCRLGLAALSVGAMKRCAQLMLRYAERRGTATGRLLDNPVTLEWIAEIVHGAFAIEALGDAVAELLDRGEEAPVEAYMACKITGPELLCGAVDRTMQLLGRRGYIETSGVPQMMRDARLLRMFDGPTETLEATLGTLALRAGDSLRRLLVDILRCVDAATALDRAIEELRRLAAMEEENAVSWWRRYEPRVGRLAGIAVLWAAVASRPSSSARVEAERWARGRFETLRLASLEDSESPSDLVQRVIAYRDAIGDVEQGLPGEDHAVDRLLRREPAETGRRTGVGRGSADDSRSTVDRPMPTASRSPDPPELRSILHDVLVQCMRREMQSKIKAVPYDMPFARLGLDSLTMTNFALDVEKRTGHRLTVDLIYQHQTLDELASILERRGVVAAMAGKSSVER